MTSHFKEFKEHMASNPGKIFIYLLGLWLVLYGLLHFLNINDKQHNKPLLTNPNEFSRELLPLPAPTDGGEQQNALFHEYKFFYFPELPMKRLQNALLQDLNIKFECPDGKKQTLLPSANFEKTTLANILCTLLQEVGFGFYYADNVITAMPMNKLQMALNTTITSSTMLTSGTQPVANVTGYQATFPMQSGKHLDWWVSGTPAVFLRIAAQPLYYEGEQAHEVGFEVEAQANGRVIFHQNIITAVGEMGAIEIKGRERSGCRIKPLSITNGVVRAETVFYFDKAKNPNRSDEPEPENP